MAQKILDFKEHREHAGESDQVVLNCLLMSEMMNFLFRRICKIAYELR
jgi:hypothetical protein